MGFVWRVVLLPLQTLPNSPHTASRSQSLFNTHPRPLYFCTCATKMTRTARKNKKKEPLPASSWEELSSNYQDDNNDGTNTLKDDNLKLTHKKKLGTKLSAKTKTRLKTLTGKKLLKRTNSDCIQLIEPQLSEDSTTDESVNETENISIDHKSTKHEKLKKNKVQDRVPHETITGRCDLNSVDVRKHKTKLKQVKSKKRKKQEKIDSMDKVRLIQSSSDSDDSLNDQVEMVHGDEEEYGDDVECKEMNCEGEYCELGRDGKEGGENKCSIEELGIDDVDRHETSESWEESEKEPIIKTRTQKTKKRKRTRKQMESLGLDDGTVNKDDSSEIKTKKVSRRVKIGNRWVKDNGSSKYQDESLDCEVDVGRKDESVEDGVKKKRKRRMDEESKRKRIEHRKLRRQRKKVQQPCTLCVYDVL